MEAITDLLTRIRNAGMARHASTRVPCSKMKSRILQILKNEGYIENYSIDEGDGIHRDLVIYLRYLDDFKTVINKMRRISKPGRRVYMGAKEIPMVKSGLGIAIVSTSRGVMTDREARRQNLGGEVLCEIW